MPPGKLVGMGLTKGGVDGVPSLCPPIKGGLIAGELDLDRGGLLDLDRDLDLWTTLLKLKSVGLILRESLSLEDSFVPTIESIENPSFDFEAAEWAELAEFAAATAAAAERAAAAAALWGKVTDIMGGSAARVIIINYNLIT